MRAAAAAAVLAAVGGAAESWVQHAGRNCYSGHGATEIDGSSIGSMSLAACEAKCDEVAACTGITVSAGSGNQECFRRADIQMSACDSGSSYDTWTPAPPAGEVWTAHAGKNCYADHGATDLESPAGSSCGAMSLAACEAKCDELAACTGVVVAASGGDDPAGSCYRRSNIQLSSCSSNGGYTTYTKQKAGPPTPAPPPPPPTPSPPPGTWTAPDYRQCGSAPPAGDWAVDQIPAQNRFDDSWIPAIENGTCDGTLPHGITCAHAAGKKHYKFPPGQFELSQQVWLPTNVIIEGAADPNDPADRRKRPPVATNTFFVHLSFPQGIPGVGVQCSVGGSAAETTKNTKFARPGFLMNSNTVVRNANVQGQLLGGFSGGGDLCGFGLFELPGCIPTFSAKGASVGGTIGCMAGPHNSPSWERFDETYVTGATPLSATGRAGYGVENVLIENVRGNDANSHRSPVAFWSAMAPDNAPHKNITMRRFVNMKGVRDGLNVHGNVQGFLAEDIHLEDGGDDILGVWGAGGSDIDNPIASDLIFRRVFGRYDDGYNGWGDCVQLFGVGSVAFEDYTCCARATYDPNNNQNGRVALNFDNYNCCSPGYTKASKFTVTNLVWASHTGENWCKNPQAGRPPVTTENQPAERYDLSGMNCGDTAT